MSALRAADDLGVLERAGRGQGVSWPSPPLTPIVHAGPVDLVTASPTGASDRDGVHGLDRRAYGAAERDVLPRAPASIGQEADVTSDAAVDQRRAATCARRRRRRARAGTPRRRPTSPAIATVTPPACGRRAVGRAPGLPRLIAARSEPVRDRGRCRSEVGTQRLDRLRRDLHRDPLADRAEPPLVALAEVLAITMPVWGTPFVSVKRASSRRARRPAGSRRCGSTPACGPGSC